MQLTLCMLVKNEEKRLAKAINSVKSIIDELIVVDTGSKDKTKQTARKLGAKVFDFKWNDDFSSARNFSIKKATKEWILVLDADETINKRDINKIKGIIRKVNKDKKIMGVKFIQRTYSNKALTLKYQQNINDGYTESRDYKGWDYRGITRLFRNDKKIYFEYPIHETVIESIKKAKGELVSSFIPIHHFGNEKGNGFLKMKHKLYLKMLKAKVKKFGKKKFLTELEVHKKINDL